MPAYLIRFDSQLSLGGEITLFNSTKITSSANTFYYSLSVCEENKLGSVKVFRSKDHNVHFSWRDSNKCKTFIIPESQTQRGKAAQSQARENFSIPKRRADWLSIYRSGIETEREEVEVKATSVLT